MKKWYKLDNVGKFFSSIAHKQSQNVFRYSVTLKTEIDEEILNQALDQTLLLFPNFNVHLKKGFFWYYLEEAQKINKVTQENLPICFRVYNNSNDFLYRVSYYQKRINLEVSHILSDGRGCALFFRSLVMYYLKIKYCMDFQISTDSSYMEKSEDSFLKYYKKTRKTREKRGSIYTYSGRRFKNRTRYLEAHLEVKEILKLAHSYDSTLTSFMVSILIDSCKEVMSERELKKMIKIEIPVDLREYFKSSSSKNYFAMTSVCYRFQSRDDTLEDIIKSVNKQLKENLVLEKLSERVNQMVAFEQNLFCRVAPLFVKNIVLKVIDSFSSKMSTTCVSNVGKMRFDAEFIPYIENVNAFTSTNYFQFVICSFENDLSIGISSKYRYHEIIKNFCNYFSRQGLSMVINVSEVD